ncbi:MAG: DegT/DnrJ/EryC1/StrS family aminotransferase [Betaproteobacteria bacterium]|jgi:dTDP-4-amino-4,6-dideoxygalactose transaminase|nr:DegT/DnrJ/EryC1/StrS aminotransferase family protein [Rhodocyclaceae bacterium]MCA3134387.1 DegT/DnrJ/EryC1/StrS aminotransferase family protein [Rhodocyclaceae bacterium]MCA3141150.1 DegT/DnrJ/EryC1/StrS aminotransferase family protein [Rhodocyclaceae bacterium]MCA3145049.1 DegT/DnrJ/EryC1/StrS aminotransferase family protein [Rhodocyclaceae bacterium]MCE2897896.1 DegT/DnrJ/EryC1/StrS aminotransferase family protein [Betaproteobacteria bacterium]
MTQPFLPFTRPHIDEATIAGVVEVLRSGWITSGPQVKTLEAKLSARMAGRPVRALATGTGALELALHIAGVQPGDEVITTPLSWVATANVIVRHGARPVFVDIDPRTRLMDVERAEAAITPRSRAIIPVDLAGVPVDRDCLYALARRHGLRVIEDAAQSLGARWRGRPVGSFGDLVCFSFHANKNITTAEGGALVMNDEAEAARCERLRLQGVVRLPDGNQEVEEAGAKLNLTDVLARIGVGQLDQLDEFTTRRAQLARRYFERLDPALGLGMPVEEYEQGNWHMFQVLLPLERLTIGRGEVMAQLHARGIGSGVHYPAMHLFGLYRRLGYAPGNFPHAEAVGAATLTLPLFPAMEDSDVDRVCTALRDILAASFRPAHR